MDFHPPNIEEKNHTDIPFWMALPDALAKWIDIEFKKMISRKQGR